MDKNGLFNGHKNRTEPLKKMAYAKKIGANFKLWLKSKSFFLRFFHNKICAAPLPAPLNQCEKDQRHDKEHPSNH